MKTIGIKLADGSFFPIMDEEPLQSKSLKLTTANNNQTCVMVDLYRSENASMEGAEYIDTLKIENLIEHPNGEPSFELNVQLDENNQLIADIQDPETGAKSDALVSLITRPQEELSSIDDYSIIEDNDDFFTNDNITDKNPTTLPSEPLSFDGLYDKETQMGEAGLHEEETTKKTKVSVRICVICAAICVLATLIILFCCSKVKQKNKKTSDSNEIVLSDLKKEQKEKPKAPSAKDNEVVVIKKADNVEPANLQKNAQNDAKYIVKWGDTLWDISNSYYQNPWKYEKIAKYNNIKNADYIISGTQIIIPAE